MDLKGNGQSDTNNESNSQTQSSDAVETTASETATSESESETKKLGTEAETKELETENETKSDTNELENGNKTKAEAKELGTEAEAKELGTETEAKELETENETKSDTEELENETKTKSEAKELQNENEKESYTAEPDTENETDTQTKTGTSADSVNKIAQHHRKTGCLGEIKRYPFSGSGIEGAFCVSCREEWIKKDFNASINISPDVDFKPIAHHYVPSFCCLQISDTGYFVKWKGLRRLKKGDHIAWLRCPSYWHHAIVKEVRENEIVVIEWTLRKVREHARRECDLVGNCCYSPMYKVMYPKEIEEQNPPDLVLLRATTQLGTKGYSLLLDNCEHFATFCKTGSHKSNQIFQYSVSLRTWIARFVVALINVLLVVSFSETIEYLARNVGGEWLGAISLIIFEIIFLGIAILITILIDTANENFRKKERCGCTSACKRAILKSCMQSITLICGVALCGIYILQKNLNPDWSVSERVLLEIGFGILGGVLGSMFGFILFRFIPYPCCHTDIGRMAEESRPTENENENKGVTAGSQLKLPTDQSEFGTNENDSDSRRSDKNNSGPEKTVSSKEQKVTYRKSVVEEDEVAINEGDEGPSKLPQQGVQKTSLKIEQERKDGGEPNLPQMEEDEDGIRRNDKEDQSSHQQEEAIIIQTEAEIHDNTLH